MAGKYVPPSQTRGYLNNNPGNVDRSPNFVWNSEIRDVNDPRLTPFQRKELTSGRFAVFPAAAWGIRIIPKNLQSYQKKLGLYTVRGMISRWAPPNENNTEAYINRVCATLKVDDDERVDMWDYEVARVMTIAIIEVELGGNPYPPHVIEDGLRLAGLIKKPKLTNSRTKQGAALVGGGVATINAPEVITEATTVPQRIQEATGVASDVIAPMAATSSTMATIFVALKIIGIVVALGGLGWMLYSYLDRKKRDGEIEVTAAADGEATEPEGAMVLKG
jgi:hypothetical protein